MIIKNISSEYDLVRELPYINTIMRQSYEYQSTNVDLSAVLASVPCYLLNDEDFQAIKSGFFTHGFGKFGSFKKSNQISEDELPEFELSEKTKRILRQCTREIGLEEIRKNYDTVSESDIYITDDDKRLADYDTELLGVYLHKGVENDTRSFQCSSVDSKCLSPAVCICPERIKRYCSNANEFLWLLTIVILHEYYHAYSYSLLDKSSYSKLKIHKWMEESMANAMTLLHISKVNPTDKDLMDFAKDFMSKQSKPYKLGLYYFENNISEWFKWLSNGVSFLKRIEMKLFLDLVSTAAFDADLAGPLRQRLIALFEPDGINLMLGSDDIFVTSDGDCSSSSRTGTGTGTGRAAIKVLLVSLNRSYDPKTGMGKGGRSLLDITRGDWPRRIQVLQQASLVLGCYKSEIVSCIKPIEWHLSAKKYPTKRYECTATTSPCGYYLIRKSIKGINLQIPKLVTLYV